MTHNSLALEGTRLMRGVANPLTALFSYASLEKRVPRDHPVHKTRILVDVVRATMDADCSAVYAKRGRPSIPPEFQLRVVLIQILYTVRSARQLVEHVDSTCCLAGSWGFRSTIGFGITPPSATTESACPTRA